MSTRQIDLELASQYLKEGNTKEALDIASNLLNQDPNDSLPLFIAAWAFIKAERFGMAHALLRRSLELKPKYETLNNLAMASIGMQRLDEATQFLLKALKRAEAEKIDPCSALNNLALIEVYNCNPQKAIEYAEKSFSLKFDQWELSETYGYAKLMLGDYTKGWLGHEALIGRAKARKYPVPGGIPYWMGEPVKNLYVRGEQGVGDEISFASCIPDAMKEASVVLECDAKLEGLFKRSFPGVTVYGTRKTDDREWMLKHQFDAHCLTGTLLKFFRKKKDDFPGTPYLKHDPERFDQWKVVLDKLPGKKIGIAWTGGLSNTFKKRRSMELETMLPLLKTPGITWVSLQYIDPTEEIAAFEEKHGIKIHHWKRVAESQDYDDQAALVMALDSVVSVTTAIVHLCGALGKECHVLVPSKPRWFYGLSGNSLPWYKSVKLYRQTDKWPLNDIKENLLETECKKAA
jgi:tetratricopeptide (TPR) repeat protein